MLIRRFLFEVDGIIHDPSTCQAWLQSFCKTLQFQDLCKEPNQYALFLLDEARAFNDLQQRKQQMRWVRAQLAKEGVTSPTQEQLDEKWLEMYGNEESPQDAPNGNAGEDLSTTGNRGALELPTSCDTFTADGDTREDSLNVTDGSNAALLESGASANLYGDTRDDSRGRYAPPSCSPEDGNPAETAPSHGGSVASLEARQSQALVSRRTDGSSVRGMAKVAQPSVRSRASFRNKEEFIQWAIDDGLDPVDAGECWEATEERGGKDADGNTVKNMKAFARQWCRTRANNRRTA